MYITVYLGIAKPNKHIVLRHNENPVQDDFFARMAAMTQEVTPRVFDKSYIPRKKTYLISEGSARLTPTSISEVNQKYEMLRMVVNAMPLQDTSYSTFHIPKHSGGYREINAPSDQLLSIQRTIVDRMLNDMKIAEHDAAFAYVKQRSPLHAMMTHQANKSRWFLKLDVKDFFPSCTMRTVEQQLNKIYQLQHFKSQHFVNTLFLGGSLPQGSAASPLLSNLVMLEFDYALTEYIKDKPLVYTRYADDILISSRTQFNWEEVVEFVQSHLPGDMQLKTEKTRYATASGRNWNLGLMYNKDLGITVGHARKKRMKSMLYNFNKDLTAGTRWELGALQSLLGELQYIVSIEQDALTAHIEKINPNIVQAIIDEIKSYNQH